MAYNGSGSFNIQITLVPNASANAEDINAIAQDIATGLTNAMTRDGQSPAAADIPLGGHKITGLSLGSADSDGASIANLYQFVPAGTMLPFAGSSAPTGFLLPYGQIVNRADYPKLFAAIGTTYNTSGETALQFRLPDMRGRTFAAVDNMGGTAANVLTNFGSSGQTIGAKGGEQAHVLTTPELASHNHGVNDPSHGHGINDPPHSHGYVASNNRNGSTSGSGGQCNVGVGGSTTDNSVTGISINAAPTNISIQYSGGNTAHNNVQPTMLGNWIIKT